MTVNKTIQLSDYNNIRQKVIDVLGTGSASFGYGQPLRSSAVIDGSVISVTDWNNLSYDVINTYVHQVGSTPTLPAVTVNTVVETSSAGTTFNATIAGTTLSVKSVATGMVAIGQTITSGATLGTQITGKLENSTVTITSLGVIATETVTADYYNNVMYKVTYNIPIQSEAPAINQWYTVEGNSNNRFNGTVKCTASTTTSISLVYNNNPENVVTATYATEVPIVISTVYDAAGLLTESGPNKIFTGKSTLYMTAANFSAALTSGLTIGSGISGTGIPVNTYITDTERVLIGSTYYHALVMSNLFTTTSTTPTITVGSNGTKLKVSSTLNIDVGMVISGGGVGGYSASQTVTDISNDGRTLTTSAAPTGTPTGTITFKNVYGTGTTTFKVGTADRLSDGNPWGNSTWVVTPSQTRAYTSMTATEGSNIYPFSYYSTLADTLQSNRFNIASGQFITANKGSKSNNVTWSVKASMTTTMSFTTSNKARSFFNSGGAITLTSTLSGGTATQQYNKWVLLLDSVTYSWGGSSFYTLTSTPAQVYLSAASSPYTGNYIRISASTPGVANNSTGTATSVAFLIEYVDGYNDPGPPAPGDGVAGNLSVFATTKEAYGFLVPAGAGNFTVESPTVSYGEFTADGTISSTPSTAFVAVGSQSYTGSGAAFTFTQPAGSTSARIFVRGPGGGGGASSAGTTVYATGGSGGGGGYAVALVSLAAGQQLSITVGLPGSGGIRPSTTSTSGLASSVTGPNIAVSAGGGGLGSNSVLGAAGTAGSGGINSISGSAILATISSDAGAAGSPGGTITTIATRNGAFGGNSGNLAASGGPGGTSTSMDGKVGLLEGGGGGAAAVTILTDNGAGSLTGTVANGGNGAAGSVTIVYGNGTTNA